MSSDWITKGGAVVTGAAGGIGRSIALTLAKAGCDVLVADIDIEGAKRVAAEVNALGRRGVPLRVDVSSSAVVKAMADKAYAEFGNVTVLANNAGVTMRPFRALWDTSDEDFKWMFGINYFGVQYAISAFVPRMLASPGRKHIINTSSMATLTDPAGHGAYNATKSAVDGLSNSLRNEVAAENIGVTILYPGRIDTRISTSERLRPESERSQTRGVKPYSDYVDARLKRSGQTVERHPMTGAALEHPDPGFIMPIDVDTVGPMVLEAIQANRPVCLTHPVPQSAIAKRVEYLQDSYHPLTPDAPVPSEAPFVKRDLSVINLVIAKEDPDGVTRFHDLNPELMLDTPGVSASFFWGNEGIPHLPDCGSEKANAGKAFPGPGGTKLGLVCFPARSAGKLDLGKAEGLSNDAAHGRSHPGMHKSQSVDYEIIISGKVDMVLESGERRTLRQGDCLVMGGVYHAWEQRCRQINQIRSESKSDLI